MNWDLLLSGVASALAALFGAWAGAAIAFKRFQRERTFDRRLQWHLDALEIIHGLEAATRSIALDKDGRDETYKEARQAFARMVAQAPAFMTDHRARQLRLVEATLWEYTRQTRDFIRDGEDFELVSQAVGQETGALDDAEKAVLTGIHRLMPPDREFSRLQTLKGKATRLVARRRRRGTLRSPQVPQPSEPNPT